MIYKEYKMKLISPAFVNGGILPLKYTCDGDDISPPLEWQDTPIGTKSFALIYDDPDAPGATWIHWILYNIPTNVLSLPENIQTLPEGTKVGINSWSRRGYGGACPPSGEHRYIFTLYALGVELDCDENMTSQKLQNMIHAHILDKAILTARYSRHFN